MCVPDVQVVGVKEQPDILTWGCSTEQDGPAWQLAGLQGHCLSGHCLPLIVAAHPPDRDAQAGRLCSRSAAASIHMFMQPLSGWVALPGRLCMPLAVVMEHTRNVRDHEGENGKGTVCRDGCLQAAIE